MRPWPVRPATRPARRERTWSSSPSSSSSAIRRRTWCCARRSSRRQRDPRGARARERRRRTRPRGHAAVARPRVAPQRGGARRGRPGGSCASSTSCPTTACSTRSASSRPGPLPEPVEFRGVRLGLPICEDVWFPDGRSSTWPRAAPSCCSCPTDRRSRSTSRSSGCTLVTRARPRSRGLPLDLRQPGRRPGRARLRRRIVRGERRRRAGAACCRPGRSRIALTRMGAHAERLALRRAGGVRWRSRVSRRSTTR